MSATEQQVRMAAQLYEMRDTARRLLGERYHDRMKGLGAIIKHESKKRGVSEISAATSLCKERGLLGFDVMLVMAAAVELTEPSA